MAETSRNDNQRPATKRGPTRRTKVLNAIFDLTEWFAGTRDLQDVLDDTARSITQAMSVKACGIRLLNDTAVLIDNSFYVAGREDLMKNLSTGNKRKNLDEITRDLQRDMPLILMDHQPFHLELAEKNGVDLQLSGHTHHGQLWPFNYITGLVYEKSRGYLQKGNTHYYVSAGVGGWGPPVRTVSRPEIVHIKLDFD